MKSVSKNMYVILLALLVMGATACASKEKAAAGPASNRAAETTTHGTVEVQPDAQELKRQQADEAARLKQAEMDRLKEEEAKRVTVAAALPPEKLDKVYFDYDKYDIKQTYRVLLERDASAIKGQTGKKFIVEGHCDERGSEEYNLALGERRAKSVKAYLASLGVDEGQLDAISYGEERPAETGHDENAWSKNRRVQFSQE